MLGLKSIHVNKRDYSRWFHYIMHLFFPAEFLAISFMFGRTVKKTQLFSINYALRICRQMSTFVGICPYRCVQTHVHAYIHACTWIYISMSVLDRRYDMFPSHANLTTDRHLACILPLRRTAFHHLQLSNYCSQIIALHCQCFLLQRTDFKWRLFYFIEKVNFNYLLQTKEFRNTS